MTDRHGGLKLTGTVWGCDCIESPIKHGAQFSLTQCHHCRIAIAADLAALGPGASFAELETELAHHLGVACDARVPAEAAVRGAAWLADDVAVLRMLDRIEAS